MAQAPASVRLLKTVVRETLTDWLMTEEADVDQAGPEEEPAQAHVGSMRPWKRDNQAGCLFGCRTGRV